MDWRKQLLVFPRAAGILTEGKFFFFVLLNKPAVVALIQCSLARFYSCTDSKSRDPDCVTLNISGKEIKIRGNFSIDLLTGVLKNH